MDNEFDDIVWWLVKFNELKKIWDYYDFVIVIKYVLLYNLFWLFEDFKGWMNNCVVLLKMVIFLML